MFTCTDQLGRNVELSQYPPKRIISLVPSVTELLHDLGLENEVVGITKFCVHPQSWFRNKTRIGGTKNININKIRSLAPDLVIANKEENVEEQVNVLSSIAPVWVSDIDTFEDALDMIRSVGILTRKKDKAEDIIAQIKASFRALQLPDLINTNASPETSNQTYATCCYLIWRNPYMTVGGDTFISDMLHKCGLNNVFEHERRYPAITLEQAAAANPQLVLLSSEPYPFKQQHIDEIKAALPHAVVLLVDGEIFSWYGSRMLHAAQYFHELRDIIFRHTYFNKQDFC